jgi:hypothetical protein
MNTAPLPFRKLSEGDLISWTVDFLAPVPWVELNINGGEFTHRFTNLTGNFNQYLFGIVMVVEHEFILIPDGSSLDALPPPPAPVATITSPEKISGSTKNGNNLGLYILEPRDMSYHLLTWDPSLFVQQKISSRRRLSLSGRRIKSEAIRICSSMTRIAKSLLALTLSTNENRTYESNRIGIKFPFEGVFSNWLLNDSLLQAIMRIALCSHSSMIRLVATKLSIQLIHLLPPRKVDDCLVAANLMNNDESFVELFFRRLGRCLNPYATPDPVFDKSALLSLQYDYVTSTLRQTMDILTSIGCSPLKYWWQEFSKVIRTILPKIASMAQDLKEIVENSQNGSPFQYLKVIDKYKQSDSFLGTDASNCLIGVLAICGGWIPAQALVPGAVVTHSGLGSSLLETFAVVAFSTLSMFGEALVICPLNNVSDSDIGISPDGSDQESSHNFSYETVFATFLQSEQTRSYVPPAVLGTFRQHADLSSFLGLLNIIISTDSTDQRPPLPYELEPTDPPAQPLERSITLESPHPYRDNTDEIYDISIPGASELVITFDPQSKTETNYDYLRFFKDSSQTSYWGQEKYSGTTWPGVSGVDPLRIPAGHCLLQFHTDGSNK